MVSSAPGLAWVETSDTEDAVIQGSQTSNLNCVILGDNPSQIFSIPVAGDTYVSSVRELIKEKVKPRLDAFPFMDLELYKVDLSGYNQLSFDAFNDMIRDVIPTKPLFPTDQLYEIFPSGSLQDENLHIVIICPTISTRGADEDSDIWTSESTQDTDESDSDADDDSNIFDANDIQDVLAKMGYQFTFPLFGHPLVAVVSSTTDDTMGIIKFVPKGCKEAEILQHLSAIDSPRNHTIAGVRVWTVRGGHIISMHEGGNWLTDSGNHDLWSVAGQLIEAIDFMHQHGVAHLDLKPANILIPKKGGRLSIIDFHTSVRIEGVKTMLHGMVGTPEYMPPEVEADGGGFSALRADLWSCGKTLSELCYLFQPSADCEALLKIAQALMDEDPEKRPMMSDVLETMAGHKSVTL